MTTFIEWAADGTALRSEDFESVRLGERLVFVVGHPVRDTVVILDSDRDHFHGERDGAGFMSRRTLREAL